MSRYPLLAFICLFAVMCGCASRTDELSTIRARGTIRIGVKAETPPFGVHSGALRWGFDIDIATAVARRLGVEPEFVDVTSADRIDRLRAGDVDLLVASLTITRSREQLIDFSIPYFQDGYALLVKTDSAITSYASLTGKRVGVGEKTTGVSSLRQVAPDATLREYPGYDHLFVALERNEIDALAGEQLVLMALIKERKVTAKYRIAGNRFTTEPFGIALRQNQSELRAVVNNALQDMWECGEWRQIADTWFGPSAPYATEIHFVITPFPK